MSILSQLGIYGQVGASYPVAEDRPKVTLQPDGTFELVSVSGRMATLRLCGECKLVWADDDDLPSLVAANTPSAR